MDKFLKTFLTVVTFCTIHSHANASQNDVTFGGGLGALYAGFGVNIGLRSEKDFKYIAAGCPAIGYSDNSGWKLPCGIGIGWIWSGILTNKNNKHGLGIYLGPVGVDNGKGADDDKARYGIGITYEYFFKGINTNGWHIGITPAMGKEDDNVKGSLLVNGGYQF